MSTHNPGPWRCTPNIYMGKKHSFIISACPFSNGEREFAEVMNTGPSDEANARLIACAPELLATLESLVDAHPSEAPCEAHIEMARAIIARARGDDSCP